LVVTLKETVTSDALYASAVKAAGGIGADFYPALKGVASNPELGTAAAQGVVKVLGESSQSVLTSLAASGRSVQAVEGLGRVLRHGIDPELVKRVLGNDFILSAGYRQADLLEDMGKVAHVKGFEDLAKTLANTGKTAHGFRYELEVAVWMQKNGMPAEELTKRIATSIGKTDIDVVGKVAGQTVFVQAKSTTDALKYGEKGLKDAQAWVTKARAELGSTDPAHLRYAVPPDQRIPPQIQSYLERERIRIVRIPHR
jgi:hypothetical protein